MRTFFISILLLEFLLVRFPLSAQFIPDLPQPVTEAEAAVVKVEVTLKIDLKNKISDFRGNEEALKKRWEALLAFSAPAAQGTGFFIQDQGKQLIVTNHHVIWLADTSKAESIQVTMASGTRLPARLVDHDPLYDLAFLELVKSPAQPAPNLLLANQAPAPNTPVYVLGYPQNKKKTTSGVFQALQSHISSGRLGLIHNVELERGDSGSPLLDREGTVLGVNVSRNPNLAISAQVIRRLLAGRHQSSRRAYLGLELRQRADGPVYIKKVIPNSPADLAALKPGTVESVEGLSLSAINGTPVRDLGQVLQLLEEIPVNAPLELQLTHDAAPPLEIKATINPEALQPPHLDAIGRQVISYLGNLDKKDDWPSLSFHAGVNCEYCPPDLLNKQWSVFMLGSASTPQSDAWPTPNWADLGAAARLSTFSGSFRLWLQPPGSKDQPYNPIFTINEGPSPAKLLFY